MRKLIITIACAFVAQAQGEEYNWRLQRELRNLEDQQDEIIEQNEKIAKQNERLANQLRSDEFQRQLDAERAEQSNRVDRWISERRSQRSQPQVLVVIEKPEPTPETKPIPSAPLPTTPLEEYFKAKAALPAGYVIDKPNADGTITATKVH